MALPGMDLLALQAFDAALGDERWRAWSEDLILAFGADGGALWLVDDRSDSFCRSYFCTPEGGSGNSGLAVVANRQVALASELPCAEETAALKDGHLAEGPFRAGITLYKLDPDEGEWVAKRAVFDQIFSKLIFAFRLAFAHDSSVQGAWWRGATAAGGTASILVGRKGELLQHSEEAARLLDAGDPLAIREGIITPRDPASAVALLDALALLGSRGSCGALALPLKKRNGRVVRAILYPCAADGGRLAGPSAAALMRLVDPVVRHAELTNGSSLFGFTRRESEIANLIVQGHSIDSASTVLSVSRNTTRNHMQALLRKTETNRQADLVRVLLAAG